MSPHLPALLESFGAIEPKAAQFGRAFYTRLIDRHPELRLLFGADLGAQADRLVAMIATAVHLAGKPAALEPALHRLGRRHLDYGVLPGHYPLVGEALIDTLAEVLAERFTPRVRQAWTAFYATVASAMLAGAELPEPETAGS